MFEVRRMIVVAVLALVAGLLILFPARAAYHWFAPPELALGGLSGSIWSGKAKDANVAGVYLQNMTWRMRPHRLLFGRLAYAVEASPSGGFINGEMGVTLGGTVDMRNLRGSLPLAMPAQALGFADIGGVINADFDRLQLEDGAPVIAQGSVEVTTLLIPLISPTPIGNFVADFITQEDGVVASVEDTEATVDLAGRLLLNADRSYDFLGHVAPKPETPPALRRLLPGLGPANERGQYELRQEGTF